MKPRDDERAVRRDVADQTEGRRWSSAHAWAAAAGLVGLVASFVAHVSAVAPASSLPVLGQIEGVPHILAADGSRLVLGNGLRLDVVEVTDAGVFHEIGRSRLIRAPISSMAARDGRVYAIIDGAYSTTTNQRWAELEVLELADAGPPTVVGSVTLDGIYFASIALADGVLYLTNGEVLRAIDVSDPTRPRTVGEIPLPETMHIAASAGFVYALTGRGLMIVDTADPGAMRPVAKVDGDFSFKRSALVDNLLLIGGTPFGDAEPYRVEIYGVTDPLRPVPLSTIETRFNALAEFAVDRSTVFVAGQIGDQSYRYALDTFDIRRPAEPVPLGPGLPLVEFRQMVLAAGRLVFLTDRLMSVVDVGDAARPREIGMSGRFLRLDNVFPVSDAEVLTSGEHGIFRDVTPVAPDFDTTDPARPRRLADLADPVPLADIEPVAGALMALGGGTPCRLVALTGEPGARAPLHPLELGGACRELAAEGNRVYAAAGDQVTIVDASEPGTLRTVGRIRPGGEVRHVAAANGLAWVAWILPGGALFGGRRFLDVFDVSDPAAPRSVGQVELVATVAPIIQGPSEILARGRVAWVADGPRLRVFEVTAEGALVEHTALAVPQDSDHLAVDGDLLIVHHMPHETTSNLAIFDVSEPRAPRPVATFDAQAFPFPPTGEVAAHDGRLFVTSGGAAYVLDLDPLRSAATPTPTSGHGEPQKAFLPAAWSSSP